MDATAPKISRGSDPNDVRGHALPVRHSRITRYEDQPRRYFDPGKLEALAKSLAKDGQQQPIKVRKHPKSPGSFEIIDGERRWRAFKLVWDKTGVEPTVDCIIDVVTDDATHYEKSLLMNLHRDDLIPLDEAMALDKLFRNGKPIAEIAASIGKSVSFVDGRIKLHSLPEEVKAMMSMDMSDDRRLSVTSATEIARSTRDTSERIAMAKEVVQRGLGVLEAKHLLQTRTSSRPVIPSVDIEVLESRDAHFYDEPLHTRSAHAIAAPPPLKRGRKPKHVDARYAFSSLLETFLRELSMHIQNFRIDELYDDCIKEADLRNRDTVTVKLIVDKLEGIMPIRNVETLEELVRILNNLKPLIEETAIERFRRKGRL